MVDELHFGKRSMQELRLLG